MTLDPEVLLAAPPVVTVAAHTVRDTLIYAMGVGAGQDPARQSHERRFLYEADLQALPTMAVALAYPADWIRTPTYGLTWKQAVFVGQDLRLRRPIPVEGHFRSVLTIEGVEDKGVEKGALIHTLRDLYDEAGLHVASLRQTTLLRGDGGGGSGGVRGHDRGPIPDRPADVTSHLVVRPDQALIYRLSGDMNALHVDPDRARRAGFPRPPLHGLCTYGMTCRLAVIELCDGQVDRFQRFNARLGGPVFPGDTLQFRFWRTDQGARVEVSADGRERPVLTGEIDLA